jgi:hypothetical protein
MQAGPLAQRRDLYPDLDETYAATTWNQHSRAGPDMRSGPRIIGSDGWCALGGQEVV